MKKTGHIVERSFIIVPHGWQRFVEGRKVVYVRYGIQIIHKIIMLF